MSIIPRCIALVFLGFAALPVSSLERIVVAPDGRAFVESPSRRPFRPHGFNYDRDHRMRLLEEYWDAEWDTVAADLREAKGLGANVLRIHLQFGRFMTAPDKANDHALAQLKKLLALAEREDLYLDLTGLACYRRKDVPAWYADLEEQARWSAQANFWSAVADTCKDSPAVFCYDLVNEPAVPKQKLKPGQWLTGDLAGFTYCQFLTLDPAGRTGDDIARNWTRRMTAAIRRHDPARLITIGLLPNTLPDSPEGSCGFSVAAVAPELDFVAVHFYPRSGKLDQSVAWLRRFAVNGRPLVVEEVFPIHCTPDELIRFMNQAGPFVGGWISFYWGQTPDQLAATGKPGDALTVTWLRAFRSSMLHRHD